MQIVLELRLPGRRGTGELPHVQLPAPIGQRKAVLLHHVVLEHIEHAAALHGIRIGREDGRKVHFRGCDARDTVHG